MQARRVNVSIRTSFFLTRPFRIRLEVCTERREGGTGSDGGGGICPVKRLPYASQRILNTLRVTLCHFHGGRSTRSDTRKTFRGKLRRGTSEKCRRRMRTRTSSGPSRPENSRSHSFGANGGGKTEIYMPGKFRFPREKIRGRVNLPGRDSQFSFCFLRSSILSRCGGRVRGDRHEESLNFARWGVRGGRTGGQSNSAENSSPPPGRLFFFSRSSLRNTLNVFQ